MTDLSVPEGLARPILLGLLVAACAAAYAARRIRAPRERTAASSVPSSPVKMARDRVPGGARDRFVLVLLGHIYVN